MPWPRVPWIPSFNPSTLRRVLDDPDRKALPRIVVEAALFALDKRERPARYFHSYLYRRGARGWRHAHLSQRQYDELRRRIGQRGRRDVFWDKLAFHRHFQDRPDVRLPRLLGHVEAGVFYGADGHARPVREAGALRAVVRRLRDAGSPSLFAKRRKGNGGAGAVRVDGEADVDRLHPLVLASDYVVEETVRQHPDMQAVHPGSLSTVRITTCQPPGDAARAACAFVRFGVGESVVDNVSSGGFFAGVDLTSGRVRGVGIRDFGRSNLVFARHPDTGARITGLQIPDFAAAVALAETAATYLPLPIAGWDVALTPDGPVLIEGNDHPHHFYDEMASGSYWDNPVIGPFIRQLTGGRPL